MEHMFDAHNLPIHFEQMIVDTLGRDNYRACIMSSPSYLYKPRLFIDGNQWCALLGDNVQDGVAGFGASPAEAFESFDKAWHEKLPMR